MGDKFVGWAALTQLVTEVKTRIAGRIAASEKGASNGVATLDATGRVPYTQLPESAMEFEGGWNASTNNPTLKDGTGTNGDFYVCNVAGTVNFGTAGSPRNVTFYHNDRAVYDGSTNKWIRLPAGEVRSVNGMSGDVVLSIPAAQVNSDWNASSGVAQILNKPELATVATSGNYNDLSNKPSMPAAQVNSDWNASSGVAQILNKPTIPTSTNQLTNDSNFTTTSAVSTAFGLTATDYGGKASTAGTADNATNVDIATSNSNGDYPLLFTSNVTAGNKRVYTDTANEASYNPSTNALKINGSIFSNGYQQKRYYDIDASSLSTSNFYPVTFGSTDLELDCEIHSPNLGGAAPYNQNLIHFLLIAQGWSDTPKSLVVLQYGVYDANEITLGSIAYGNCGGTNCIWVRGGLRYRFFSNQEPTLRNSNCTIDSQTFTVGSGYAGSGSNPNVTIIWTPDTAISASFSGTVKASAFNGNASSATKATQDGNGNEISTTYATKSEVPTKVSELANDSGFITSSGSITGSSGSCTGNSATATNAAKLESKTWRETAHAGLYVTTDTRSLSVTTYTFTLTAPAGSIDLDAGNVVRITFRYALQSSRSIGAVNLSYGGRIGAIKVAWNNSLLSIGSRKFTGGPGYSASYPYKVWDNYTTLELMWTGSEWLVMGNPTLCYYASTTAGYTVKANGLIEQYAKKPSTDKQSSTTWLVKFSWDSSYIAIPLCNYTDYSDKGRGFVYNPQSKTDSSFTYQYRFTNSSGSSDNRSDDNMFVLGIGY